MTPPYIFFCGLKQEQQPHVGDSGYLLPKPGASPSSGRWKKRSHFILFLFLSFSFIHWLKMFVHDTPLSLYMDTYISLVVISSPTLPLDIAPIWWSMSTIWWSLSLFETLTIWDHQCRHGGTADQMSPVTAPSRAQNWPISEQKTKPWQLWRCWQWWWALVTVNNFDSCW